MKKSICVFLILVLPLMAFSQQLNNDPIILLDTHGTVQSVEFSNANDSKDVSYQDFLTQYLKVSSEDSFIKTNDKQRTKDYINEHFDQYYKGLKVEGGGYNFHYNNKKLYFAHGHFVKINKLDINPEITPEKAKELFARYKKIPSNEVLDFTVELLIKEILSSKSNVSSTYLVFKVFLRTNNTNNTEIGFIDAKTGDVLLTEPIFTHITPLVEGRFMPPATGTFATRYNGTRTGITDDYSGSFHLSDPTKGALIHTWNLNGNTDISNRVELSDNDNNWTMVEHGFNENDMGLDVHWALQQIYNHLSINHGINSFDDPITGAGFPIDAHIKYGTADSQKDNAGWSGLLNILVFGDGASVFRPVASLDVVAHEYGHGITDFQIGWGNTGNTGAFNEGLSDIWGAIMEYRINPNNVWQIGEQLTLNNPCLRDIQNTNLTNVLQPIASTFGSVQYNTNSGSPEADKYVRSGVFSHWAYLLANGGSGTNGIGNYYTVYGVGMDQLENLIVAAVFNNFLDNTTTYSEIRTAMVNAARSLCSNQNGFLVQQVENAWYAVGVGSANQLSINAPSLICPNTTLTVNNLQTGSSVTWSSSNSSGLTINNSGVATRVNNFNGDVVVTATITSACGSISITKTVRVGSPITPNLTIIGVAPYGAVDAQTPLLSGANYNWYRDGTFLQSGTSNYVTLNGGTCGVQHYMQVSLTNSCGTSPLSPYGGAIPNTTYTWACGFRAYPNPTKDYLIVEFENAEDANALPERINFYQETSTNLVKSIAVQDIIKQNAFKDGNKIELDVKELPRGTYYLHIIPNSTSNQKVDKIRIILE